MSQTANWSYTNKAMVRPFLNRDLSTQKILYGEPYEIACTWEAKNMQVLVATGSQSTARSEYTSKYAVYTEDPRPKYQDLIQLDGQDEWQTVLQVTEWDMSFFGETKDFMVVT